MQTTRDRNAYCYDRSLQHQNPIWKNSPFSIPSSVFQHALYSPQFPYLVPDINFPHGNFHVNPNPTTAAPLSDSVGGDQCTMQHSPRHRLPTSCGNCYVETPPLTAYDEQHASIIPQRHYLSRCLREHVAEWTPAGHFGDNSNSAGPSDCTITQTQLGTFCERFSLPRNILPPSSSGMHFDRLSVSSFHQRFVNPAGADMYSGWDVVQQNVYPSTQIEMINDHVRHLQPLGTSTGAEGIDHQQPGSRVLGGNHETNVSHPARTHLSRAGAATMRSLQTKIPLLRQSLRSSLHNNGKGTKALANKNRIEQHAGPMRMRTSRRRLQRKSASGPYQRAKPRAARETALPILPDTLAPPPPTVDLTNDYPEENRSSWYNVTRHEIITMYSNELHPHIDSRTEESDEVSIRQAGIVPNYTTLHHTTDFPRHYCLLELFRGRSFGAPERPSSVGNDLYSDVFSGALSDENNPDDTRSDLFEFDEVEEIQGMVQPRARIQSQPNRTELSSPTSRGG